MRIGSQNVSVSYCMVIDSNLGYIVVEFYDEKRLSAGTKTMSVGERKSSDRQRVARIAWEFRKSLED